MHTDHSTLINALIQVLLNVLLTVSDLYDGIAFIQILKCILMLVYYMCLCLFYHMMIMLNYWNHLEDYKEKKYMLLWVADNPVALVELGSSRLGRALFLLSYMTFQPQPKLKRTDDDYNGFR